MKRLNSAKDFVCGMRALISTKAVRTASQLASTANAGAIQSSHKYSIQVGIVESTGLALGTEITSPVK
ncbi:hypothetical protein D3C80_957690 [compost metagenome]